MRLVLVKPVCHHKRLSSPNAPRTGLCRNLRCYLLPYLFPLSLCHGYWHSPKAVDKGLDDWC